MAGATWESWGSAAREETLSERLINGLKDDDLLHSNAEHADMHVDCPTSGLIVELLCVRLRVSGMVTPQNEEFARTKLVRFLHRTDTICSCKLQRCLTRFVVPEQNDKAAPSPLELSQSEPCSFGPWIRVGVSGIPGCQKPERAEALWGEFVLSQNHSHKSSGVRLMMSLQAFMHSCRRVSACGIEHVTSDLVDSPNAGILM
ncbi:hypothetical protein BKA67DRAFT_100474 [Truncatella angustata]|uniref:Uncharacterized protein n=1 Tax=Truncatella angustata TaxID=152316 RepID=A0A9P8RNA5_9PEZI|nr:uncharacterized protein BKA67DRAFT_100474 [Truncatella angustata]KAH6646360.1 hypothetical protein BKA67DRAFT_100474 [Truncatella angustata]